MKLTLFLILISVASVFASKSYAQTAMLNLNMKNSTVKEVLQQIEKQSEFYFMYSEKIVDVNRRISVDANNKKIDDVLNEIFNGTDVNYTVKDRFIVLTTPEVTAPDIVGQQQSSISGTITDDGGEPLPGVTVIIKGTTQGTVTDIDGNYTLPNVPADATLQFSFVGMKTQEILVGSQTTINVTLLADAIGLDEVVAIGYGTVSRKNLTTAISKVEADKVEKSATSNMSQLMLGRAAGLQATVSSPQPGGAVNVSIRGGGNPIYVIDGIVMPSSSLESSSGGSTTVVPSSVNRGGLAGLNPEDIESIEVLKDASAAIYGVDAANGVILVTTKKGKEAPMNVNYNGSYSFVKNYPYIKSLNATDYMGLVNTFSKEQYLYNNEMGAYGSNAFDNGWTQPFSDEAIANAESYDWVDEILRNGAIHNHNLVVSGGSKKVTYYVSGNYFKQDGTVTNSSMERYALRSNLSLQLTSFLKLSSIMNVNRNKYENSSVGGASSGRGSQAAGALTAALSYPSYLPVTDENGDYTLFSNIPNAVSMQDIDDDTESNGTYLNFTADITLIKDMLSAKLLYGNNKEATNRYVYIPSYVYFDQTYQSRGNIAYDGRENQTFEATLSFNKQIGEFMNMNVVAGVGKYLNSSKGLSFAYDTQHDVIANDNVSAVTGNKNPGSYKNESEKRSQFLRANFDILDRYVIATTLRRDGTDKFFPEKKYGLFPSVSVAWKMTNEEFLNDVSWLDLLKLRASYGTTGSDNLGSALYGTYSPSLVIKFEEGSEVYSSFKQNGIDYPNVTWQKTEMKNIGLDFYMFKNRVSGSFDIFQNDVTNMLGYANTAGLSMFGTYPINGGHIRRRGWDAMINTENIRKVNFTWNSTLTLSKYNSVWMERFPNYDYKEYQIRDEEPTNARYYYKTNGMVNADLSNIPSSQPEEFRVAGFPIIVDDNNDGEITVDDVVMSNEVPKLYFGFGNTFTYKNWDLDVFVYSQLGVNKYNYAWDWANAGLIANQTNNENKYAFDLWSSESNQDGRLPGYAYEASNVSLPGDAGIDVMYQDASFLRFRNITLGYNITGKQLGSAGKYFNNIRVYVDAQNPLTITNFEGYDPEIRTGGSSKTKGAEYPQTRTFSVGVKINFN
ncbi:SusC/RagA family TonB-linked outer membrane protein [Draconibacterium sp. IB214405]|uniref:SusC/RagA family TonB-linked outer membrane protein n=1 Tax=Draconibacterium sp. IB214405 TaxID=3097352 RepID=UPI002A0F834A|nr:SusC/RagA family TonB-linked outer membrane protein [Draconibacterium sp. IB214405]MDX8339374.1 SusC/RagA family TonB-linked outer membrane protein [Draconibacterium sp. IB214405]